MEQVYYLRNEGLLISLHDPFEWALAQVFAAGEMSYHGGTYICTAPHIAIAAYEPGVGADWDHVFEPMAMGIQGAQGIQGIPGGTMAWKGLYNAGTTYAANDGVISADGRGCYALQATTGNAPPSYPTLTNAYWSVFAEKGGTDASTLGGAALSTATVPKTGASDIKIPTEQAVSEGIAAISADDIFWKSLTPTTDYDTAPASTSTITMNADKTTVFKVGCGVRYTIGGTVYYGVVTALTASLLTVAGAPLSGTVSALAWCDQSRVGQLDFYITGVFADGVNPGLLATDAKTKFQWNLAKAYLVQILHTVRIADTGANQPRVNASIGGTNNVGISNSNAGLPVAITWTSTIVDINPTNYDINPGEAIEIVTDANGTNDNAQDLTVSLVFVMP
jgi:hypothetical protein